MAKKRKKEKEESYEFKEPEFDEEEYLKKEVRDAKAIFVTFLFAALIGLASFGLTFVDVALAALLGLVAIVFLRHIYPLIGIDTTSLEKKQWAGNIIMYLFTWLAIWILLVNPPFSDFAEPNIEDIEIYFGAPGNWTKLNESNQISFNNNISINATVTDNVDVDVSTIRITIERREGENYSVVGQGPMNRIKKNRYAFILDADDVNQGAYRFTISASDKNDHKASYSGTFNVI